MIFQELESLIERNELPDISKRFEMQEAIGKYPYFQPMIFIYLKCLFVAADKLFNQELKRLSVFVSDKRALFYYVMEKEYERFFSPKNNLKEIGKTRTEILINAFFGNSAEVESELETILDPPPVYAVENTAATADETPPPKTVVSDTDKLLGNIDRLPDKIVFEPARKDDGEYVPVNDSHTADKLPDDDLFFTETLANIYIKQQKYERACEIIKRLNLKYPEKNIYFASQISFLEKLIIIHIKNKK
jgi:hypothetical protein